MKTCLTFAIALLVPAVAAAQSSSLFPSSGGSTSGRSTSSSSGGSFGSTGGGSSTQQGLGGGGGASLSGSGGGGESTLNQGTLQQPDFMQFGQAGTAVMDGGFVGAGQAGTFIGVDATTGQGPLQGQQGQQGLSGLGNRGQQQGQSQGRSTTGSGRSRTQRLQPVVRIAFEYEPRIATNVQAQLAQNLSEINLGIEGLAFDLDADGVLTMTGVAATEDDSRLAEAYVRLEPGVRQVENLIVVAP